MFYNKFRLFGAVCAGALLSGCAIVNTDTRISARSTFADDTISRTGESEGPANLPGNSFTSILQWASVGDGEAEIDSSALTLRHAPTPVSASSASSSGLNVFSATDSFSVEGSRNNTAFSIERFTSNVILGRYTETSGSGTDFRGFATYSAAGFVTPLTDIVTLGLAGGTVAYRGDAIIEVFDGQGRSDVAVGNALVNVDFGDNDITGNFVFRDAVDSTGGPELTNFNLDVTSGTIAGNTFSASISGDPADLGAASLDPISASGNLFGAGGADLSGNFSATGTQTGGGDLVVIGGFLATN